VHVEYVYTSWLLYGTGGFGAGDVLMPATATRRVDGEDEITRTLIDVARVARDSSPPLSMPDTARASTVETPGFLRPTPLDTVRLGPQTFVLANPGYNEIVSLLHDTVYVLDATQSEARRDGVLWASDYIQTLDAPALDTTEVYAAACRFSLTPSRVVAQHHPLADWSTVAAVVRRQPIADYPTACR
jgi:hypothetical protein